MYYDAALTGKRIQKLRKSQGLTQEQLAEELNISAVHMSKIEIGKRSCSLDVLAEIAVFFGASLDYLVLGKSTEKDLRGRLTPPSALLKICGTVCDWYKEYQWLVLPRHKKVIAFPLNLNHQPGRPAGVDFEN